MKKSSVSSKSLGLFPSPGAPIYRERSIGGQKGWSSERVPHRAISSTRHASVAAFYSGRTLPSKWDEAERWICSPLSGYVNSTSSNVQLQIQRRPKSKSGPIVPPGIAYYSPTDTIPLVDGLGMKNLMVGVGSPFSTGVLAPDAVSVLHYHYDACNGPQKCPTRTDNSVAPSSSSAPHTCSQPLCLCDSQDEGTKNEEMVTCVVSKCDKATQMSPERENNNSQSSEKSSPTCSKGPLSDYFAKLEVRDVQVDSQATVTRWSKRYGTKLTKKDSPQSIGLSESGKEDTSRDLPVSTIDVYKLQGEEAKIIAWENLQKAKTEEAIRKLEMKLEKKRSSSMNKIASKLRRAQMKAEKMRSSLPVKQEHQLSKTTKGFSFPKYTNIMFPSSCFGCHHP